MSLQGQLYMNRKWYLPGTFPQLMYSLCLIAQSCLTLCSPMDCSPGSFVHGIFQTRKLNWFAISFSRGSSQPRDWTHVFCLAGGSFITVPPGKPLVTNYEIKISVSDGCTPHWHDAICKKLSITALGGLSARVGGSHFHPGLKEASSSHRSVMTFGCLPCAWSSKMSSRDDR